MMPEVSLVGVLIVAAVAFVVPLALGLIPALRVPSVVIEIVAGIIIGPAVLGLVEVDEPLQFMALIGLAFLLLLAGMEIDLGGLLRGGVLRSAGIGFALSLVIARSVSPRCWGSRDSYRLLCSLRSCSQPPRSASSSPCSSPP